MCFKIDQFYKFFIRPTIKSKTKVLKPSQYGHSNKRKGLVGRRSNNPIAKLKSSNDKSARPFFYLLPKQSLEETWNLTRPLRLSEHLIGKVLRICFGCYSGGYEKLGAWNHAIELLNLETQNLKVISYVIWNPEPRLVKNQSSKSAFWTGLMHTEVSNLGGTISFIKLSTPKKIMIFLPDL